MEKLIKYKCDPTKTSISIYVLSWANYNHKASEIASILSFRFDHVTVVSSSGNSFESLISKGLETGFSCKLLNQGMLYGSKLDFCMSEFDRELFFVVNADAVCEDWIRLVEGAIESFICLTDLAVWCPFISYTPWTLDRVELCAMSERYSLVAQTDGIVFCWSKEIVHELKKLPIRQNNSGWGIDWASVCTAGLMGKKVLLDKAFKVSHPRGTSYDKEVASKEFERFLRSFSHEQFECYLELKTQIDRKSKAKKNWGLISLYRAMGRISESDLAVALMERHDESFCEHEVNEVKILLNILKKSREIDALSQLVREQKLRLWIFGVGTHTSCLLLLFPKLYNLCDAFLDSKSKGAFLGKSCFMPSDVTLKSTDIVIISSQAHQVEMANQIRGRGVSLLTFHP